MIEVTKEDLDAFLKIMELSAARGAFRLEEFPAIGAFHAKIKDLSEAPNNIIPFPTGSASQ